MQKFDLFVANNLNLNTTSCIRIVSRIELVLFSHVSILAEINVLGLLNTLFKFHLKLSCVIEFGRLF